MVELFNKLLPLWTDFRYLIFAGMFLVWIVVCNVFIKILFNYTQKLAAKTKTDIDNLLLKDAKFPLWLVLIILGFFVISKAVGLPPKLVPYIDRFAQLSIVFLIIYFAVRVTLSFMSAGSRKNTALENLLPTFSRLANLIIWAAGILLFMDLFGISITPILASLGIAGLAVGLALQDTLANFFSGLYILMSQPVRIGDYIRLESGEDGYVDAIGWRETRVRTLPGNIIVIPNSKLSQSRITNFYQPVKAMAALVQVGVSYGSDLEKVEKVTIEVGEKILKEVKGADKDFKPFIRYHTFADFSINFTVILRVNEFVDKYLVTHEFIKALHKRYKQEGIEIPFPIRTVHMKKEA